VLIDPASGLVHPFPRPISLKNAAIAAAQAELPGAQYGPLLSGTPKGDIRHLVPAQAALDGMDRPAQPVLLLFPRYGLAEEQRPVGAGEAFVRLTQASTNYVGLGEAGFTALTRLVTGVMRAAIDYPDTDAAAAMIERLW